jgi:hypothetical protein
MLLLLLLAALPLLSSLPIQATATSQVSSIPISLGFGPTSVSPISAGIPIYTVGDTVWVSSGFGSSISISLVSPQAKTSPAPPPASSSSSPTPVVTRSLDPQTVTPLYKFASSDTDGIWNLTIVSGSQISVVPIHFVNPDDHLVSLGQLQYSLSRGNISISADANLADSYDQEVCAAGSRGTTAVSLSLPFGMRDKGSVTLVPGSPFTMEVSGTVNESSSFWFELYHSFGLYTANSNSVKTDDLMAAASQPTILYTNANSTTTLSWDTPLRAGRYNLRAFFQNATSLDVVQSSVLIVNASSWLSLSSSCEPIPVQSQSINYSESLSTSPTSWPRTLYVMYRTFGVESFISYPVNANVSSMRFIASPWNQPLQDATIDVSPTANILQTSQDGSSLFVLASRYPAQLNYSLNIGGAKARYQELTIEGNGSQTAAIDMAKLVVKVAGSPGSTLVGTSATTTIAVDVTGSDGLNITETAKGGQSVSFVLPAGSYTVTATQGGASQTTQVGLSNGVETTISLTLSTLPTLEIILVITAVIGALGNLIVWTLRSKRLSLNKARSTQASDWE